jgi:hypothetical protein
MWHPGKIRTINGKFVLAWAVVWAGSLGLAQNQADQTAGPNVARVSFVQGSVQLATGQGTSPQPAVINMPVMDGSQLQTGNDGQVEVEFGDGSVARLTPNSMLQFDHVGQDRIQLQQLSGLDYYEFNYGDGHPLFSVLFQDKYVQPTSNTIVRVGIDAGWDVAVMTGSVSVEGPSFPATAVAEGQSMHPGDNGAAFTVAQSIAGDSWDNWNQDRDQAIAQEASQQTDVRADSDNPQNENWNDLDANGNWYPVDGNNVWVPSGVDANWDPYGAGYWGYYPTIGYTWISAYPWGWLPYHCGAWNYYSFGWGWAPGGGCGRVWSPVIVVRNHPPGWVMPVRPPFHPPGAIGPYQGRLVAVDRGAAARGPWAFHDGPALRSNHQEALNFNGRMVAPVQRADVRAQGFTAARGTGPGARSFLAGAPAQNMRVNTNSMYTSGGNRGFQPQNPAQHMPQSQMARPVTPAPMVQQNNQRPGVGYGGQASFNQRSNYQDHSMPSQPHYSPPPQMHSAPPPQMHSAPPAAMHTAPSGGGGHR